MVGFAGVVRPLRRFVIVFLRDRGRRGWRVGPGACKVVWRYTPPEGPERRGCRMTAIDFMVNGRPASVDVAEGRDAPRGTPRAPRLHLDEGRLRPGGVVRRLHGDHGRAGLRELRPARDARREQGDHHPRGAAARAPRPVGPGVRRGRRVAVRLLLAGDRHEGRSHPSAHPRSVPGGGGARPRREPMPVHRVREDRRRRPARRRSRPGRTAARGGRRAAGSGPVRPGTRATRSPLAPSHT